MILEPRLRNRANNFDALRLLAATLVLVSHCFPLTRREEPFGPVAGWTLGEVGVVMFFAMSGFLIAKSWSDGPRLVPFAIKRALRLLPALVVAVALTVFVLGPAFTTLSLADYLSAPSTWLYLARNSVLVTFSGHLPGVFAGNAYPVAVNGSLWTLPVEVAAYAMVAALGILGLIRRTWVVLAAAAIALVLSTPLVALTSAAASSTAGGDARIVVKLFAAFLLGSLMYAVRRQLPLSWRLFAALSALWVATWDTGWTTVTGVLAIAYGVLVLAFRTPDAVRNVAAPGDVSYGIYIYAFPVQQSVSALVGPGLTPLGMFLLAYPVTYLFALASWRLVERRALLLKRRLARAPEPLHLDSAGRVPVDPVPAGAVEGHLPGALQGHRRGGREDGELLAREQK